MRVYLPARVSERARPDENAPAAGAGWRGRVALHEPDLELREMVCEVLSEVGFEVVVARSPEQVAEHVRRASSAIELIVAAMPRLSASPNRFAEALRGGVTGPPVLALADVGHAGAEPLDARVWVLQKPVARAELRSALERWLGAHREG